MTKKLPKVYGRVQCWDERHNTLLVHDASHLKRYPSLIFVEATSWFEEATVSIALDRSRAVELRDALNKALADGEFTYDEYPEKGKKKG